MSDPISYIKSSGGSVNGSVSDALAVEYGVGANESMSTFIPRFIPFTEDGFIRIDTGAVQQGSPGATDTVMSSDYIPIDGYDVVETYTLIGITGAAIAFYGSAKEYLPDHSVAGNEPFAPAWYRADVPEGAMYVKVSCWDTMGLFDQFVAFAVGSANESLDNPDTFRTPRETVLDVINRVNSVVPPSAVDLEFEGFLRNSSNYLQPLEGAARSRLVYVRGCRSIDVRARLSDAGYAIALFDATGALLPGVSVLGKSGTGYSDYHVDLSQDSMQNVYYAEFNDWSDNNHIDFSAIITGAGNEPGGSGVRFGTFSVMGDSYSTFKGYMVNGAYPPWYPDSGDATSSGNDVKSVEDTWWYMFADRCKCRMLENSSYSGSCIGYYGYSGKDSAKASSFIARENTITTPELILVFGGTNDVWAARDQDRLDVFLGDYKYSDWTDDDLNTFRPALARLLSDLKHKHIGSQIVFMLNTEIDAADESVKTVCGHYGVPVLELQGVGKTGGHPNKSGMKAICDQLVSLVESL